MADSRGKRRIDRVVDPDLPARISELSNQEVRTLRDECREEESRLSYTRRLLQARTDIVRAEVDRRAGQGRTSEELLRDLPKILADKPSARREARAVGVYAPEGGQGRREEDALIADAALTRLPDLSEDELRDLATRLTEAERNISDQRSTVLNHLDALQGELVARYRDGRADIGDVLSEQG